MTVLELLWLFIIPASLFSLYHIVKNIRGFIPSEINLQEGPYPKIIFSIAARRQTALLQKPIDAIKSSCAKVGFSNYEVKLVVDEIDTSVNGAETIIVPKEFTCKSKYKARALHYALQHLPNSKDAWILHLDEDALVTTQCVTRIINYILKGGNPVANGPSVFPFDSNIITFYAEAQRQWTFYWLMDQERSSTVHWLNGSNLLIRSDIEQLVGWDFINCYISEDARFGYEATKKIGKIFGWHGGLTIETPPSSIGGLLKQRKRWFFGSILNLRYVPKSRLPRRLYSITAWVDGLFLSFFLFALLSGINHEWLVSNPYTYYGLSATAVFWLGRYQIGVYNNLKYTRVSTLNKVFFHIGIFILAPVVDILCNIPTILAIVKPPREFEITAKRI